MYEIEIKSWLGSPERAARLQSDLIDLDPESTVIERSLQLNHYFVQGDLSQLAILVKPLLTKKNQTLLAKIVSTGRHPSVRTRQLNSRVLLVIKATVDQTTSSNGISRWEFEAPLPLSLDQLDHLVLSAQYVYQAKWSRRRQAFKLTKWPVVVAIDQNAGYGFLAELEIQVSSQTRISGAKNTIHQLMGRLQLAELSQERLARMFDHYNRHWPEYYGTDKTFVVE